MNQLYKVFADRWRWQCTECSYYTPLLLTKEEAIRAGELHTDVHQWVRDYQKES